MLLSKTAEYGIQAVLSVAVHEKSGPAPGREIADEWGMPPTYTNKILSQLRRVGILSSTRGVGGGFVLAKAPQDITCLEIAEAIDGPLDEERFGLDAARPMDRVKRKYIALRKDMFRYARSQLGKTTIKQLMSS